MMDHKNCHELVEEISEYVEGVLSVDLCVELEKHLGECANCRIVVNTLRKTVELYHDEGEQSQELPDGVRERLFLRLNLEDYLEK